MKYGGKISEKTTFVILLKIQKSNYKSNFFKGIQYEKVSAKNFENTLFAEHLFGAAHVILNPLLKYGIFDPGDCYKLYFYEKLHIMLTFLFLLLFQCLRFSFGA